MNLTNEDVVYIYKALKRLQHHEPDYPGLAKGLGKLKGARSAGTDRALEKSWWEEQLVQEMKERESGKWMDERPF